MCANKLPPNKDLMTLKPHLETGHYSYFHRFSSTFSVCLVRFDGRICGSVIKTSHNSPKGCKTHLQSVHSINPATSNLFFKKTENIDKFTTKLSVKNKKTIGTLLARMACKSNFSLNALAKSAELRFLINKVFNSPMPSVNGIRQHVMNYYAEVKSEITEKIAELSRHQKWTLTFDEWTSVKMKQVLNLIIHFKDISFNLGIIEVHKVSCTSETLLEMIQNKLAEFNLNLGSNKIAVMADGASVNMKLESISNIAVQRCQNHGLNLAILDTFYSKEYDDQAESDDSSDMSEDQSDETGTTALGQTTVTTTLEEENDEDEDDDDEELSANVIRCQPMYRNVIQKATKISNSIRNSAMLRRILQKYTALQPLKQAKTRWSSLAKMARRFIDILPSIRKTYIDAKRPLRFTDEEAEILSHIPKLLCPVANLVEKLSNSKANLLTADVEVSKVINELNSVEFDEPTSIKTKFVNCLTQRYLARRSEASDVLQYLLSGKYNTRDNMFYHGPPSSEIIKKLFSEFCGGCADPAIPISSDASSVPNTMDVDLDQFAAKRSKQSIDHELEEFERSKTMGECLMKLAKVLLAIKPTSTDVERTFSICGQIVSRLRNKMKCDLLNALVVGRYY